MTRLKKNLLLLSILLSLIWIGNTEAVTYTVCNAGCDDTTIQGGLDNNDLDAGDVLEVRADAPGGSKTYTEVITIGTGDEGTAGGQVTIQARSGDTITIDASGATNAVTFAANVDYVTFDGFNIVDWGDQSSVTRGIYAGLTHTGIIIQNCTINIQDYGLTSSGDGATQLGINLASCTSCQILDSNITTDDAANGAQTDALKIGTCSSLVIDGVNVQVRNSWVADDNHADTMQIMSCTDLIVRNSYFYSKYESKCQGPFYNNPTSLGAADFGYSYFYNNVVEGELSTGGVQISNDKAGASIVYHIYNNYIRNDKSSNGSVIRVNNADGMTAYIKNNVIVQSNPGQSLINILDTDFPQDRITNNILYNTSSGFKCIWQGAVTVPILSLAAWNILTNGADLNVDPSLDVNFAPDDAGDPGVDAGIDLSAYFTVDRNGATRPVGAWDIGAYEYQVIEVSGTVFTGGAGNITDDEVVSGGSTIILTVVGTTWDADIGDDSAETTVLIAGLDSAQSEANGWDAVVKAGLAFGDVTRDSDTQVTILLPAFAGFLITANETVTVTIPSTCTASAVTIIATPDIIVSVTEAVSTGAGAAYNAGGSNVLYNADGINIVGQ